MPTYVEDYDYDYEKYDCQLLVDVWFNFGSI